ncbi:MAG: redoxin domain-containing protein [Cytophagales bacterium]
MKQLKCSLLLSILFLTFSCDKDKETQTSAEGNYFIKGTIAFASDSMLYLQQIIGNNIKKIDSVNLKGKVAFEFKGKLPEVGFYRVELKEKGATVFALDNSQIQLSIKGNENLPLFEITGSVLNNNFEEIAAIQQKFRKKIDSLNQQYILAENLKDANLLSQIESGYGTTNAASENAIKQAIKSNDKSIVSVYAASLLDPKSNIDFLDTLSTSLRPFIDNSIIKEFVDGIEKMKNIKIGGIAPDFTGNTPDGRKVSLADFKGKFVLIDFWASWCIPCRRENPNVVKLYEKYNAKNFEILGVSLDDDGTKWKNAIMADGLKWQHISDLKGWESDFATLYSIEEIPQTYLLDQEGKILARNLRGAELEQKLAEILN